MALAKDGHGDPGTGHAPQIRPPACSRTILTGELRPLGGGLSAVRPPADTGCPCGPAEPGGPALRLHPRGPGAGVRPSRAPRLQQTRFWHQAAPLPEPRPPQGRGGRYAGRLGPCSQGRGPLSRPDVKPRQRPAHWPRPVQSTGPSPSHDCPGIAPALCPCPVLSRNSLCFLGRGEGTLGSQDPGIPP